MFNQIQTYLLKRIFEDLDPNLFHSIEETTIPTPATAAESPILGSYSKYNDAAVSPPRHFKTQIRVYNQIINLINLYKGLQLTNDNYKLVVLYFEYYHLYITTNKVVEPNPRRTTLNYINYIITSLDTKPTSYQKTISIIEDLLFIFTPTAQLGTTYLNEILSDFNYFITYFQSHSTLTKSTVIHAISLTFAFEIFQYPRIANKIKQTSTTTTNTPQSPPPPPPQLSLSSQQQNLLIQFSRFYFITSWINYTTNKSIKSISLDEVAKQFCQTEFDKVVKESLDEQQLNNKEQGNSKSVMLMDEENIEDRVVEMYNAGSLAGLRSDEIIQLFQEAMKEYRFRRQFN